MTLEIKRTESSEETESTTTASRQHSEDSDSGVNLSEREKEAEPGDTKENYKEGKRKIIIISVIGRIETFYVCMEPVSSYLSCKHRQRQLYCTIYITSSVFVCYFIEFGMHYLLSPSYLFSLGNILSSIEFTNEHPE